uniref:Uncharacterized protein n=1 Tax=Eutreptiella gymnastica TaxID=73025 RepID=A0A6U8BPX5_9EUGL
MLTWRRAPTVCLQAPRGIGFKTVGEVTGQFNHGRPAPLAGTSTGTDVVAVVAIPYYPSRVPEMLRRLPGVFLRTHGVVPQGGDTKAAQCWGDAGRRRLDACACQTVSCDRLEVPSLLVGFASATADGGVRDQGSSYRPRQLRREWQAVRNGQYDRGWARLAVGSTLGGMAGVT